MKIGPIPETLIERIALWTGLVPVPLLETHLAATLAQAITAGVRSAARSGSTIACASIGTPL